MRQKGGLGGSSHERGGGSADGLMAAVRIAIRRTSLCTPKECIFCPEWGSREMRLAAVWQHFTLCVKL
ncbi:MAG: hypothetical protein K2J72_00620 [Oscillospiraceae bacterium]|nr:hypothetical protein [Oscillospiraceae bacterium]